MLQYVEDVLAEKTVPNNAVGRQLLELVNSVPNLAADSFTDAFASSIKDLLMVSFTQIVSDLYWLLKKWYSKSKGGDSGCLAEQFLF